MTDDENAENSLPQCRTSQILRPVHILTCFVGNSKVKEHRVLGYFAAVLWLINICLNFLFAFYESYTNIGAMAVVIYSVFLLNCIVCTITTNLRSVPWIDKGVEALSNNHFKQTLKRASYTGKRLLLAAPCISVVLTTLSYLCLYYDNATDLQFATTFPSGSLYVLGFLRLFSKLHVFFSYIIFWAMLVFSLILIIGSMQDYKVYQSYCLTNEQSPMTLREAVVTFNERARFVSRGSEAWMIPSAALTIHSVSSFALGAYAFLYHQRKLTYIFHAVVPLLSAIYPLTLAACVTKEYQSYVQDVVKAWVERPESDEDTESSDGDNDQEKAQPTIRRPPSSMSNPRRLQSIWQNTSRAVGRFQVARRRPKFQFEKYISYLQNVSMTTGFRVAGIVITWNKVSTLFFILFSIMAVFVQETIFGNVKSTIN